MTKGRVFTGVLFVGWLAGCGAGGPIPSDLVGQRLDVAEHELGATKTAVAWEKGEYCPNSRNSKRVAKALGTASTNCTLRI
jgi:hypothetical protein